MSQEKKFVNGMIVKVPEKKPAWVLCKLSIKVADLIAYLQENESKGWVNIDLKVGQSGKPYAELDTWKPNQNKVQQEEESQAELNSLDEAFPDEETEEIL